MREDTISTTECFIIWAAIVAFILPFVEVLHFLVFKTTPDPDRIGVEDGGLGFDRKYKVPFFIMELYRLIGFFVVGAMFELLIVETAKFTVGRLRPYFLTLCNIRLTDDLCKE